MGILSRFTALMKANINHIIDRSKNPEKEINKTLREITLDLRTLQSETNALEADERRAKRELDQCEADIDKMQRYSERAAENGDTFKAKNFSGEKVHLENTKQELVDRYNKLALEVKQLQLLEEKLTMDVTQLEKRSADVVNRLDAIDRQSKINDTFNNPASPGFDTYEEEIKFKMDEADALAELRSNTEAQKEALSIDEEIALLQAEKNDL